MIEFDLDIPSLTEEGIHMGSAFGEVRELVCSSMIDELLMIEMLILLNTTFDMELLYNNLLETLLRYHRDLRSSALGDRRLLPSLRQKYTNMIYRKLNTKYNVMIHRIVIVTSNLQVCWSNHMAFCYLVDRISLFEL